MLQVTPSPGPFVKDLRISIAYSPCVNAVLTRRLGLVALFVSVSMNGELMDQGPPCKPAYLHVMQPVRTFECFDLVFLFLMTGPERGYNILGGSGFLKGEDVTDGHV